MSTQREWGDERYGGMGEEMPAEVMTCARCGMESSEWSEPGGVSQTGQVYCCSGCADNTGCVCEVEIEQTRYSSDYPGTESRTEGVHLNPKDRYMEGDMAENIGRKGESRESDKERASGGKEEWETSGRGRGQGGARGQVSKGDSPGREETEYQEESEVTGSGGSRRSGSQAYERQVGGGQVHEKEGSGKSQSHGQSRSGKSRGPSQKKKRTQKKNP